MPRVRREAIERLNEFISSLGAETKGKCALCTQTLTHLTKTAEAKTGAPTATVTRGLADWINEDAAPGDRVSDGALRQRVLNAEGAICRNPTNKPQPENGQPVRKETASQEQCTEAMQFAVIAISQLSRVRSDDPKKEAAFNRVTNWIEEHR